MERRYVRSPDGQVHYVIAGEGEPLLLLAASSASHTMAWLSTSGLEEGSLCTIWLTGVMLSGVPIAQFTTPPFFAGQSEGVSGATL